MPDPLSEATVASRKTWLPAAFMAVALLVLSTACSDPDDLSDGSMTLPPSLLNSRGW